MARTYNAPKQGTPSQVGSQFRTDYYIKQALIEARKEQYFSQLADVTAMPKNMGKTIKKYQYIPLLDARNVNDQGLDAAGAVIATTEYYGKWPSANLVVGNASKVAAAAAINDNVGATLVATAGADSSAGAGFATLTLVGPLTCKYLNLTKANAASALNLGVVITQGAGNLYSSSKDIGYIPSKLPVLSENGGRVNRVGFKRVDLEGSIAKFGFFDEYTQESIDFDTDEELLMHINREMINGANEITEDALQVDLINAAGVVKYAGAATNNATVVNTEVSYGDLLRMSIDLDNNRTPKGTTVITGSRMIDTKTIPASRVMYIGSELLPTIRSMKDLHNNPAFIPAAQYGDAGTLLTGEVGSVDQFRIIVVPEMMKWSGAGGDASATATHYETNSRYDVFPMLVVGDGSFTTIGFQTDGKSVKFKITHKKPGEETADRNDPYGETGFMSIKWYYGFMALRPERIACLRTSAKL